MDPFIDRAVLDKLSYRTSFDKNLKRISLHQTPLDIILEPLTQKQIGTIC